MAKVIDLPVGPMQTLAEIPQPLRGLTTEAMSTLLTLHGLDPSTALYQNSLRPDQAGAPVSIMRVPVTYQQKVARMWEAYATDPLFHRLISRLVDFIANGHTWELETPIGEAKEKTWMQRVVEWFTSSFTRTEEREQDIWTLWSQTVNLSMPNTPQGLDMVTRWAARHCLLSGMFAVAWEWQPFRHGRKPLMMPMRINCYPASSIILTRPVSMMLTEQAYLYLPGPGQLMRDGTSAAVAPMVPGTNAIPMPGIGTSTTVEPGDEESFILKYDWSPGDLTTTRFGSMVYTGWGQYPMPPFLGTLTQLTLRQKLFAADIALADAVSNYVKVFKIGNKEFKITAPTRDSNGVVIKNGTIEEFRLLIEPYLANPAMVMYLPWYVDYSVEIPDVQLLLAENKYIASALELLQAFGIFASRSPSGRNEKMEWINVAGFEELIGSVRQHIGGFYQRLVLRTMMVNQSGEQPLKSLVTWTPLAPNTKSELLKDNMLKLFQVGAVSHHTLMESNGLTSEVENRRMAEDIAREADQLHDAAAPTQFKQQSTDAAGKGTTSTRKGGRRSGRKTGQDGNQNT